MVEMLPKLFFVHFQDTCFFAESHGKVIGFIIGFDSQSIPTESYIHFAGLHPDFRKSDIARSLYNCFFNVALKRGRNLIRCITSPINIDSISFHKRLGFDVDPGDQIVNGVYVAKNYDGVGIDRVLFSKVLKA